jgi:hypothetical protein
MNTGRHKAYAAVMARGYRAGLVGVSMHRANDEDYSRPRHLAHRRLALIPITGPEQEPSKERGAGMYMLREVYQAERGKAPEIVAAFKTLDQWFEKAGYTNRRIYVDYTGPMDTVVYQWEFESLDEYFTMERGTFIEPDKDAQALIDAMNTNARSGYKEIYEVIK